VEPAELPDTELAALVVEVRTLVDAVDACWVLLLGEFDRRRLWQADGARSAGAWLRRECRMVHPATTWALTAGRALAELPATREAFRAGSISFEHVRAIAPAVTPQRLDLVRRADPIFARAAVWMTPRQVARVVRTWADLADP
jgi:hypothetical protein